MASMEEGEHIFPDGMKAYKKTWKTESAPKAILLVVHGYSDHSNRYGDFFPNLAASGIEVRSFDQRGWGRTVQTPAQKGLSGPTTQVLGDITSFVEVQLPSSTPVFMFGHSMGGAELLHWAVKGPTELRSQIRGFITSAPLIRLHPKTQPSSFTLFAGRLAGKLLPHRQMVTELDLTAITHDVAIQKEIEADPLCHNTGTLEGLAGMLDRGADLDSGRVIVGGQTSLIICHGDSDRINDFEASKQYFERLQIKDKSFKTYEGGYHSLYLEPTDNKTKFTTNIRDFIFSRMDGQEAEQSPSKL